MQEERRPHLRDSLPNERVQECMYKVGVFSCDGDALATEICKLSSKFKTCSFPSAAVGRRFEVATRETAEEAAPDPYAIKVHNDYEMKNYCNCIAKRESEDAFYYQNPPLMNDFEAKKVAAKFENALSEKIPEIAAKLFINLENNFKKLSENPHIRRLYAGLSEEKRGKLNALVESCKLNSISGRLDKAKNAAGGSCSQTSVNLIKGHMSNHLKVYCMDNYRGDDKTSCNVLGSSSLSQSEFGKQVNSFYELMEMPKSVDELIAHGQKTSSTEIENYAKIGGKKECDFEVIKHYIQMRDQNKLSHADAMKRLNGSEASETHSNCFKGYSSLVEGSTGQKLGPMRVGKIIESAYELRKKELSPQEYAKHFEEETITNEDGSTTTLAKNYGEEFLAMATINVVAEGARKQCKLAAESIGALCVANDRPEKFFEDQSLQYLLGTK